MRPILTAESVTELGATARGAVLVAGSHGGLIACHLGAAAGAHAMILNDAGVGLDDAGIAGLKWLEPIGMAVATVLHTSARATPRSCSPERRPRMRRHRHSAKAAGV